MRSPSRSNWLARLAAALYRSRAESRTVGDRTSFLAGLGLLSIILIPLSAVMFSVLSTEISDRGKPPATVLLDMDAWRVVYGHASAEDPALWTSPYRRGDAGHRARMSRPGGEVWMGMRISLADLAVAARAEANNLILGYLNGTYEVWIDGQLWDRGTFRTHMPTVLTLPVRRLSEKRELVVAIRLINAANATMPDTFNPHRPSGLATAAEADRYRRFEEFAEQTRQAFFGGMYLVLGALFLLIWLVNRRRPENFFMAAFVLFHLLLQILEGDVRVGLLDYRSWDSLRLPLAIYEGTFSMLVGLAFARTRRRILAILVPILLVLPWVALFFFHKLTTLVEVVEVIEYWWIPVGYFLGAGACFLQIWMVQSTAARGIASGRRQRLLFFGLGLLAIGLLSTVADHLPTDPTRLLNVILVAVLAAILLRDYREHDKLVQKAPVSEYHRRPLLPDRVSGVLLTVDLKRSELLLRRQTSETSGVLLQSCLSRMLRVMVERGGTIIATEGDALTAFFDEESGGGALARAVEASVALGPELDRLYASLRALDPSPLLPLRFRAAITAGDLRPIWEEVANARYAAWIALGPSNAFLEAARCVALEHRVGGQPETSVVVMPESVASLARDVDAGLNWIANAVALPGKHSQIYVVSAYSVPHSTAEQELAA